MKKIEEIIEMMKEVNPDIKMDENFKKSLKNKLEVTSYAKLKNTKNKKINVAKSGFFSFKKTNSNIFEKPKINFLKLLSPIFIGAFAVFGFFNFYGQDLFIADKGEFYNHEIDEIWKNDNFSIQEKITKSDKIIENNNNKQIENKILEKEKVKKNIREKIQKINEKKRLDIQERKKIEEAEFTRKIMKEMNIDKKNKIKIEKTNLNEQVKEIKKNLDIEGGNNFLEEEKPNIINNENIINTEIIDILGDDENIEKGNDNIKNLEKNIELEENNYGNNFVDSDSVAGDSGVLEEKINPEIGAFEDFCNSKNGKIENNICIYGEKKCSFDDFLNKKCDKN